MFGYNTDSLGLGSKKHYRAQTRPKDEQYQDLQLADLCRSIFAEALVSILSSIFDGNKISPWEIKCGLI